MTTKLSTAELLDLVRNGGEFSAQDLKDVDRAQDSAAITLAAGDIVAVCAAPDSLWTSDDGRVALVGGSMEGRNEYSLASIGAWLARKDLLLLQRATAESWALTQVLIAEDEAEDEEEV